MYIPWKLKTLFYETYQIIKSVKSTSRSTYNASLPISFFCSYHQTTGATIAIASIANILSDLYSVDAYTPAKSAYSRLLCTNLKHRMSHINLEGDIILVDIGQDPNIIYNLKNNGKFVILTCHAFPTTLHSVNQIQLKKNLEICSRIHFVSHFQADEFSRSYPNIPINEKSFLIPNYIRKSRKNNRTYSVGIVGHLNREFKRAKYGIKLADLSNARRIECWGSKNISGLQKADYPLKLKVNGWSDSIHKVHESFDVLISVSQYETFGLVVAEALSAGIPCFLSDIPVYRELYSNFPGVLFETGNEEKNIESINTLLRLSHELKPDIIRTWQKTFSEDSVRKRWREEMDKINHEFN